MTKRRAWRKMKTIISACPYQPRGGRSPYSVGWGLSVYKMAYEGGNVLALIDAVCRCRVATTQVPPWLVEELIKTLIDWFPRSGAPFRRWERDDIDLRRFQALEAVRISISSNGDSRESAAPSWSDALDAASALLVGHYARGSAAAIKKSIYRVNRNKKREPGRYFFDWAWPQLSERRKRGSK